MDVQAGRRYGLAASAGPMRLVRPADSAVQSNLWPLAVLAAAFVVSCLLKAANVGIGGPQYMIDDFSAYDGGFLVWFGQAPPQHAFLECWTIGLCSLAVFAVKTTLAGGWIAASREYIVAAAFRDYYNSPDLYYAAYRSVLIAIDLATAAVVFRLARRVFDEHIWPAVGVTVLYLFSYNTLWCVLVGRPDTLMACAATCATYLYLKSKSDWSTSAFWWAAVCCGLAAGLKMHGALLTIFVMCDVVRVKGFRNGWRPAVSFAATAFFFFFVADGSLLFDPLKYVKARWATFHDDYSPYLHWGQQFGVILRSTGWLVVPAAACGAVMALLEKKSQAMKSVAVLALGWLAIFCLTRQLRGYWTLSALPLFYILAVSLFRRFSNRPLRLVVAGAVCAVMAFQIATLSWKTRHTDLNELRDWVTANVAPQQQVYIVGDSILRLPLDTRAMQIHKIAYERQMASDLDSGMPFVERHLKNWEEAATLQLFDMLGYQNDGGHEIFRYREMPPEKFGDLVSLDRMDYLVVQQQFPVDEVPGLRHLLAEEFRLVGERRSEGGDGSGLVNRIYQRVGP